MSEQTYTPEQLDELRSLLMQMRRHRTIDVEKEMLVHIANKTDLDELREHAYRRHVVGVYMHADRTEMIYSDDPRSVSLCLSRFNVVNPSQAHGQYTKTHRHHHRDMRSDRYPVECGVG